MSATNLSSAFKGLGQWMMKAVEGSPQGVEAEIQELEQKIEAAKGKTQADYQVWLGDLCYAQEACRRSSWAWQKRASQSPSTIDFPTGHP